ncbi:hypothetical protein Tco_0261904 [Tanacetum coccineum]
MTSVQPSTGLGPNSKAPGYNGTGPEINNLQISTGYPHLVNFAPPCAPEIAPDLPSMTMVTEDAPASTTITSPSQTSPPDTGVNRPENTITTSGSESFENYITNEFDSEASSSSTINVNPTLQNNPPIVHEQKWTKDHLLENVVRNSLYVTTFTELPLFTISPHTGTSIVNIGFLCNVWCFKNYFKTRQPHNQTQFLSTTDRSISNLFDTTLSMTTLADKSLLSGGDNKPPMLEKHLYDSWKSRMELYMMNRPHGRMILASVEKGPLVWPSITVDGVTRLKEYTELTPAEAIQADCDIKAINIILQGLPTEIYALVSQHRIAKDLWEKIKLLMQGTSFTKQERECKLYDEFDKFTYKKGESLHEYYLRFTLLLNDMNLYKMPLEQFQVNTKFLNTLPDEWSKFVTDVKFVKDLHTTNVDPLALVAYHQITQSPYQTHQHTYQNTQLQPPASTYQSPQYVTYPSNDFQSSIHHNVYSPSSSSIPQLEYLPQINQHSEFSQQDSGLTVLVFQKGDDPIDAINHIMSFFTAVVTSRNKLPSKNEELHNNQFRGTNFFAAREGHSVQTVHQTQREKGMIPGLRRKEVFATDALAEVHNHDNMNNNVAHQAVQLKTQVANCTKTNLENKSVNDTLTAELERYKEQVKVLKEGQNGDLRSKDNVLDTCAPVVEIVLLNKLFQEHLKENESFLQTVTLLKNDFKKEESRNIDREIL